MSSIFKWVPASNGDDAIPGHIAVGVGLYVVDDTVNLVSQNDDEHIKDTRCYLYDRCKLKQTRCI